MMNIYMYRYSLLVTATCCVVSGDDVVVAQSLKLDHLSHSPPEQFKDHHQGYEFNVTMSISSI